MNAATITMVAHDALFTIAWFPCKIKKKEPWSITERKGHKINI